MPVPVPRRFSEDDRRRIAERYESGESIKCLSVEWVTKKQAITSLLLEQGVKLRDPWKRRLSWEAETEATSKHDAGESLTSLAKRYGVSVGTIRRIVLRNGGTEIRGPGGPRKKISDGLASEMEALYRDGWSQAKIAERFSVGQVQVSRVLRARGMETKRSGPGHWSWTGGQHVEANGYRVVWMSPDHPFARMRPKMGYVKEHRLVMAEHLGRPLTSDESVHHVNGDKLDNAIDNLQLRRRNHGEGIAMVCADCGSHNVVEARLRED